MNLMYLKNLRSDRDGGTTGLLSGQRSRYRGGIDGGGGSSGMGMAGAGGLGVSAGPNSRSWFNSGSGAGVTGVGAAMALSTRMPSSVGSGGCGTATGAAAGATAMNDMQHLRTHLLMDLHPGRGGGHVAETSVSYGDEHDRGSGGSRASHSGGATASGANNRWNSNGSSGGGGGGGRTSGGGGGGAGGADTSRADYRYQRVRGDSSTDSANVTSGGGSRSVRSGLYDTEVCLSVSGLGNVRGTMAATQSSNTSGRSGKQVSFGREGRSPDAFNERGTIERAAPPQSLSSVTAAALSANVGVDKRALMRDRSISANKENSEARSTFPRSSIVASDRSSVKRPSPERGSDSVRLRTRDETVSGSRRRPVSQEVTGGGGSGAAGTGPGGSLPRGRRDVNRVVSDPTLEDLVADPKDVNLNNLTRDCIIIPVHQMHRFLPEGVTMPQGQRCDRREVNIQCLDVDDPQLMIMLHFMTPFMSVQPVFESPLARPAALQRTMASQLLSDLLRERPGAHGMLLVSIEQDAEYPFINYGVVNRQQTNAEEWQQTARLSALERFAPETLRYFSDHLVDVYEEAATIARPPVTPSCRKPQTTNTGYIICVYKVFDGDDGERFERNWLYWTGARKIYECIPRSVELRRMTLHKTLAQGDKVYTLVCECTSFTDHLQDVAYIAPALRARLCGYCSIYRVADIY